jgi:DNA-binding transcriptional LysR family regulator
MFQQMTTFVRSYVIGDDLNEGRLIRLLPEAKLPRIRVYGITPKLARQNATVQAVLDILSAGLRAQLTDVTT